VLARFGGYRPVDNKSVFVGGVRVSSQTFFGQPRSTPGAFMVWHDQSGQWAGEAEGFQFFTDNFGASLSSAVTLGLPGELPAGFHGFGNANTPAYIWFITNTVDSFSRQATPHITVNYDRVQGFQQNTKLGTIAYINRTFFNAGDIVGHQESFFFPSGSGTIFTESVGSAVVRTYVANNIFQNWMAHFTSDGVPGIDVFGGCFKQGIFTTRLSTITTLAGGATLADVIAKVNEIVTKLQTAGIIL
jgi:hypothetical protein